MAFATQESPPNNIPGGPLYAALHPRALQLVKSPRGRRLTSMIGGTYSECASYEDFVHTADIAVLFAYLELGGDVRYPDQFAWTDLEAELLQRARMIFRHGLEVAEAVYADVRQRNTVRREIDRTICDLWDQHRTEGSPFGGLSGQARSRVTAARPLQELPSAAERDLRAHHLTQLLPALESVLSTDEFDLLVDLYFLERTVRDVALMWAATRPDYAGPDGLLRAQRAIWKCKSRALKRARERLPQVWATLAQDGAA